MPEFANSPSHCLCQLSRQKYKLLKIQDDGHFSQDCGHQIAEIDVDID